MRLNQFRWRRRIMVGACSLSDPVQLIQINFWSGTETAGEFVPMLGGGGTIGSGRRPPQRNCSVNTRIAGQLIPAQWSKSTSART